ncbi:MAG: pilus assembly protein N-terminal domain-containing protein [bacterium]
MKRYLFLGIIILFLILFLMPLSAFAEEWVIEVGDSMVLCIPNLEKIAIGNPKIADAVVVSPDEILINGIQEGVTSLHVWAKKILKKHTIRVIEKKFPLQEISKIEGLENITASFVGKSLVLKGIVKTQHEKEEAEKLAKAFNDWVINLIEVQEPLQILVNLQVIDISTKDWLELGTQWNAKGKHHNQDYGMYTKELGEGVTIGLTQQGSHFLRELDFKLKALKENGKAKTLSSPNLLTLSGKEAYVNVGGKLPIPVTTTQANQTTSSGVEWIDYGVQLNITPIADMDNNINLKIDTSISGPDWDHTVNGVPAMTSKRVATEVNIKTKDTVILSGLTEVKKSTILKRVPFMGKIPILGALFSYKDIKEDETELIVIITPEIIKSSALGDIEEKLSTINESAKKITKE